jgi:magnesium chelatase family protein
VCSDGAVRRYRNRLSGPLLDRIDIHLDVLRVPYEQLTVGIAGAGSGTEGDIVGSGDVLVDGGARGTLADGSVANRSACSTGSVAVLDAPSVETSSVIRQRVVAARDLQRARLGGTSLTCNAEIGPGEVRRYCRTEVAAEALLRAAMQRLHLRAQLSPRPQARPHHRRPRPRRRDRRSPRRRSTSIPPPPARVTVDADRHDKLAKCLVIGRLEVRLV